MDNRIELFRRIHGESKTLAREYRRLAAVYRQCGEEAKCRKYLRMAQKYKAKLSFHNAGMRASL